MSEAPPEEPLAERLTADMKDAMKSGDKPRLGTIRMLLSDVRAADLQTPPQTPEQVAKAFHKRLSKSRDEYEKLGDAATVASLTDEMKVVEAYLHASADADATAGLVDAFVAQHPEFGPRDVGRATGLFMKSAAGQADAKAANTRIAEVLKSRPG